MYEIEKTLDLMEAGEEILHLGKKYGSREFDIITKTKFIECKNWDWLAKTKEELSDAIGKICQQKQIAFEQGKIFELHSKQIIPADTKTLLCKKGINFIEDIL